MKQIIKTISILAMGVIIFSCGQSSNKNSHNSNSEQIGNDDHDVNRLSLNNGSRWQANPETTTGIKNMQQLINSFSDKESPDAYEILKSNLDNEFNLIFKNCTMKGEAHNQLHNFLLPMKDMFNGLQDSEQETQKANYNKLKQHLSDYSNYFE